MRADSMQKTTAHDIHGTPSQRPRDYLSVKDRPPFPEPHDALHRGTAGRRVSAMIDYVCQRTVWQMDTP